MLTLNTSERLSSENGFSRGNGYVQGDTRPVRSIKMSTKLKEILYVTNNSRYNTNGVLHASTHHPFTGRKINMDKLKEVLDLAPCAMLINMLEGYYYIAKGFIGKVSNMNREDREPEKVEILYAVTCKVGEEVTSPHQLKIYMHRSLYSPEYKRIMAILKPTLSAHNGDIIVTNSINNYLLYSFSLPSFKDLKQRKQFDINLKELFLRSIKHETWLEEERKRKAIEEKARREREIKLEKEKRIQDDIITIFRVEEEWLRNSIVEPEVVEELPVVGEPVVENLRSAQEIIQDIAQDRRWIWEVPSAVPHIVETIPSEQGDSSREVVMEVNMETMRMMNQALREEQPHGILNPTLDGTPMNTTDLIQELQDLQASQESQVQQQEQLVQPMQQEPSPISMTETYSNSPQQENQGEHISEEEIMNIMSRFAINTDVRYAVTLDPISETPADGSPATFVHIDEDDYVEEEELFGEDEQTHDDLTDEEREEMERALDDDPESYTVAEILPDPETRVFRAIEGGRED